MIEEFRTKQPEWWNGIRERTVLLYSRIRPYLDKNMSFLEIGCAYTYFPLFLKDDFKQDFYYTAFDKRVDSIKFLNHLYRKQKHVNIFRRNMNAFGIKKDYDFIISNGCTANEGIAEAFHERILSRDILPKYFLIETGISRKRKDERNLVLYYKLIEMYQEKGFELLEQVEYKLFGSTSYRDRYYSILKNVELFSKKTV